MLRNKLRYYIWALKHMDIPRTIRTTEYGYICLLCGERFYDGEEK